MEKTTHNILRNSFVAWTEVEFISRLYTFFYVGFALFVSFARIQCYCVPLFCVEQTVDSCLVTVFLSRIFNFHFRKTRNDEMKER